MSLSPTVAPADAVQARRASSQVVDITSESQWWHLDLAEVWRHRGLIYFLVWRDLKVRYRQTLLGVAWAVLTPIITMLVFTLFFGTLAGIEVGGLPYPLFSLAGLLPWRLYQGTVTQAGSSLTRSRALVSRVYCPRLVVPVAAVLPPIADFLWAFLALVGMLLYYGRPLGLSLLALPFVLILIVLSGLGLGLMVAALNVRYHDTEILFSFGMQLLLFLSPIIYPAEKVATFLASHDLPTWLYGLNPVTGLVELFRWCVLGEGEALGPTFAASLVVSAILFCVGVAFFRSQEDTFADYI
jgi:lipopolysaccharide transport system permease protein